MAKAVKITATSISPIKNTAKIKFLKILIDLMAGPMNIDDVHFRSRHFIYRTHGPLPTIAKSHAYINMYDTYVTCRQDMRKKT